jgi:hypothetical protein
LAGALPWVELIIGILLTASIRVQYAAVAVAAPLAVFGAAIFMSLIRGADIICGGFCSTGETIS